MIWQQKPLLPIGTLSKSQWRSWISRSCIVLRLGVTINTRSIHTRQVIQVVYDCSTTHAKSTAQEHLEIFIAAMTWNIVILSLVCWWRIATFDHTDLSPACSHMTGKLQWRISLRSARVPTLLITAVIVRTLPRLAMSGLWNEINWPNS